MAGTTGDDTAAGLSYIFYFTYVNFPQFKVQLLNLPEAAPPEEPAVICKTYLLRKPASLERSRCSLAETPCSTSLGSFP